MQTVSPDEIYLRSRLEAWSRALEARDLYALTLDYDPDVLLFDVKPPYETKGVEAYRNLWRDWLQYFPAHFTSEHRNIHITLSDGIAYAHALHRIVPIGQPHPASESWYRVTLCFAKKNGKWKVVHEHVSLPVDPIGVSVLPLTNEQTT
jgi:ketosteroid isomerase-like protein